MEKLNNVILTVQDVMGWQNDEVAALTSWINAYANLLGENQEEKAIDHIRTAMALEGDFPAFDVNRWFYTTLMLLFHELVAILQKNAAAKHTNLLKKMERIFAPETDSTYSKFGNIFDEIDFEQDKENIIKQAVNLINLLKVN